MNVPETFFSVSEELRLFGMSCIIGVIMGVVYDVFRTARLLLPHNGVLVAVEDMLFLTFYGVVLISFAVTAARGELRFYYAVGNVLGFTVYLLTVGSVVTAVMRKLVYAVGWVLRVVFAPFKRCCAFIRRKTAVKFVGSSKLIVNNIKKIKMLLLKGTGLMYNKREIKKKERGTRWQKRIKRK